MTLEDALRIGITPALSILPERMDSPAARRMLLAIGAQESLFEHRQQINGPARSYWQFERIGIQGVLEHHATRDYAAGVARVLDYEPEVGPLYKAIEHNDTLAAAFARLLLWTLPYALPEAPTDAWGQYINAWRPGRPRRALWSASWASALEVIP